METSLHRQLKERYACGGRTEVPHQGFRIDAVTDAGMLVEVQSGALAPLRKKLTRLLSDSPIHVIKPIVVARRVVRRAKLNSENLSVRFSPKKTRPLDIFDDLIGLVQVFPHRNLEIEVLSVEIDEVRIPRRRRPGFAVVDRSLRAVLGSVLLNVAADLWDLLPCPASWYEPFTTHDLSERLECPLAFAQRVAYCLRHSGAAFAVGKRGNLCIYERSPESKGLQRTNE